MIITIDIITCNDNFDRVMYPPLPVSGDAGVIREVAVPDSVDSQLCSIVHHLALWDQYKNEIYVDSGIE